MTRRGWLGRLIGGACALLGGTALAEAAKAPSVLRGFERKPNGDTHYGGNAFLHHAGMEGCSIRRQPDGTLALNGMGRGVIRCLRPDAVVDLSAFSEIRNLRWEGRGKLLLRPTGVRFFSGVAVAPGGLVELA